MGNLIFTSTRKREILSATTQPWIAPPQQGFDGAAGKEGAVLCLWHRHTKQRVPLWWENSLMRIYSMQKTLLELNCAQFHYSKGILGIIKQPL